MGFKFQLPPLSSCPFGALSTVSWRWRPRLIPGALQKAGVGDDQEQAGLPPPPPLSCPVARLGAGSLRFWWEGLGVKTGLTTPRLSHPTGMRWCRRVVCTEVKGTACVGPEPLPAGSELPVAGTAPGGRACWGEDAVDGSGPAPQTGFQGRHAVGLRVHRPEPPLLISA